MSSHEVNAIATATNVIDAVESGSPVTDSAWVAMPRLAQMMRDYGRPDLADRIDAAIIRHAKK